MQFEKFKKKENRKLLMNYMEKIFTRIYNKKQIRLSIYSF